MSEGCFAFSLFYSPLSPYICLIVVYNFIEYMYNLSALLSYWSMSGTMLHSTDFPIVDYVSETEQKISHLLFLPWLKYLISHPNTLFNTMFAFILVSFTVFFYSMYTWLFERWATISEWMCSGIFFFFFSHWNCFSNSLTDFNREENNTEKR